MSGLISRDEYGDIRSGEARVYLNVLCTASWEAGFKDGHNEVARKQTQHLDKKIEVFDKDWKKVGTYSSATELARELKVVRDGVYKAITGGYLTRKGYYFKYAS
jgi:hypothetical protein